MVSGQRLEASTTSMEALLLICMYIMAVKVYDDSEV
jgi:hypothetical protein